MILKHYTAVESGSAGEGPGVTVRWLIGRPEGAPNFAMRLFEVAPGATTPYHEHPWEHEVFVLDGTGMVRQENSETPFAPGDFVFLAPGEMHQFRNTSQEIVRFICLIPVEG